MSNVEANKRGVRKERSGAVVSKSGNKSVVVLVERKYRHPLYEKIVRDFKKMHAHDESNEVKVGDIVEIVETRPLSRLKRWRVERVLRKAE